MPSGLPIALPFPEAPDLDRLPAEVRDHFRYDAQRRMLHVLAPVDTLTIWQLRNLRPDDAAWQVLVDTLTESLAAEKATQFSHYPTTMWGMLLADLKTESDEAWVRFVRMYSRPIARSISKICRQRQIRIAATDEDLANHFFGWFVARQIHRKLSRTGPNGEIRRFRGYLVACIRTFVRDELSGRRGELSLDHLVVEPDSDGDSEISAIVDLEYCRHAIHEELSALAKDQPSVWNTLKRSFQGQNAQDIAAELAGDSTATPSRATAYRLVQRAYGALRNRLIRYSLKNGAASELDAEEEFGILLPLLAQSMREFVDAEGTPPAEEPAE